MQYPFEVAFDSLQAELDTYVSAVFSLLQSEFLILPKGDGFVDYPAFEEGYEVLKRTTGEFQTVTPDSLLQGVADNPIVMIVVRAILGFTPPEWAYLATQKSGVEVSQGFVRNLDRGIRMGKHRFPAKGTAAFGRLRALVDTASALLNAPVPNVDIDKLHRLDKADTRGGVISIRSIARMGTPYAMLLYERFLGRPFAGHRDSVSELVGDSLESAIEDVLTAAGVSFRKTKTKQAERVPGFDQAPDFMIPSGFNPQVIIKAKLTEDDGTARDKVTRVQHLAELSQSGSPAFPKFEVIACIGGRGFGVRREDMKKLLLARRGKVFTPRTLGRLVEYTGLKQFRSV
jgi:hypothetical protein